MIRYDQLVSFPSEIMHFSLNQFFLGNFLRQLRREKCACFHCGDRMRVDKAVILHFAGQDRLLCCYGCHAILLTVQKNHLISTYLAERTEQDVL